jgi:hypothetical protein
MVTYTRCMDSILCVPLMIDAAVWCDYFARANVPQDQVGSKWVGGCTLCGWMGGFCVGGCMGVCG